MVQASTGLDPGKIDPEAIDPGKIDPEAIARQTIAEPATAAAVAALIELMSALHQRRSLHQQGAPARALLVHLAKVGQMRPADLAASMNLDRSTISRHLGNLAAQGLIERDADPQDGRAYVLRVTAEGRLEAQAYIADRIAKVADIIDDWPAHDRTAFAELLTRFTTAFTRDGEAHRPRDTGEHQ